jgi:hypothetical protein
VVGNPDAERELATLHPQAGALGSPRAHPEHSATRSSLRVPTKPAMHSNSKPAGDSDLKPATLASLAWVVGDDVVWGLEGQVAG